MMRSTMWGTICQSRTAGRLTRGLFCFECWCGKSYGTGLRRIDMDPTGEAGRAMWAGFLKGASVGKSGKRMVGARSVGDGFPMTRRGVGELCWRTWAVCTVIAGARLAM